MEYAPIYDKINVLGMVVAGMGRKNDEKVVAITIEEIAQYVKKEILKDIFSDTAIQKKIVVRYISTGRFDDKMAKVSQYFLEEKRKELLKEYCQNKRTFFEEYKYEKILDEYLCVKYNVKLSKLKELGHVKSNSSKADNISNNTKSKKEILISRNQVKHNANAVGVQYTWVKYTQKVAKQYGIDRSSVEKIIHSVQKKCKYENFEKCTKYNMICTPYIRSCLFYENYILKLKAASKEQNKANTSSKNKKFSDAKVKKEKIVIKQKTRDNSSESQSIRQIGFKDFVIRTAIFKCLHNNHHVEDIVAMIKVCGDDGKMQSMKISAGYCPVCKIYFIMESTYQRLKGRGVIMSCISDSKTYLKGGFMNGSKLAQESILMQYGYNVSQTKGLSATRRQKILAVIIDNKILSKSEIISYLDFFIRQRSSRNNMGIAISKWEEDREFVENYKIGHYTQYGVNAIYRR